MRNNFEIFFWYIGLVLLQIFFFNHIGLANVINPFPYIFLIAAMPNNTNKISMVVVGFILGLTIDALSGTWGIHTMSTTLVAFLRQPILKITTLPENVDKFAPRRHLMHEDYIKYVSVLVLSHHFMLFMLEAFDLHLLFWIILKTLISSAITVLIILLFDKLKP